VCLLVCEPSLLRVTVDIFWVAIFEDDTLDDDTHPLSRARAKRRMFVRRSDDDLVDTTTIPTTSSSETRGRWRRARVAVAASVSIWVCSLTCAKTCVDVVGGASSDSGRRMTREDVLRAVRAGIDEARTQRDGFGACVTRAKDGCRARARRETRTRARVADGIRMSNEARIERGRRRERRCAMAVMRLTAVMREVRRGGVEFWTEGCVGADGARAPKSTILRALNETAGEEVEARVRTAGEAYSGEIAREYARVLRDNLRARGEYDTAYMDAKTTRARDAAARAQAVVDDGFVRARDASAGALQRLNESVTMDIGALTSVELTAFQMGIENVSAARLTAYAEESANRVRGYADQVQQSTASLLTWVDDVDVSFRDAYVSLRNEANALALPEAPDFEFPAAPDLPDLRLAVELAAMDASRLSASFRESSRRVTQSLANSIDSVSLTIDGAFVPDITPVIGDALPSFDDYDPPPFQASGAEPTDDVSAFTDALLASFENSMAKFHDTIKSFTETDQVTGSVAFDGAPRANVLSANMTPPDVSETLPDFNILGLSLQAYDFTSLINVIDVAFLGLVNIDWTYRAIRSITAVSKHARYGNLELDPVELIDERSTDTEGKKVSALEHAARLFSDPIVLASVRFAILMAVAAAVFRVYAAARQTHVVGCVESRNGTFIADYAYNAMRGYVNTAHRAQSMIYDSQVVRDELMACESQRLSYVNAYNEAESRRHEAESTLSESNTIVQASEVCVRMDDVSLRDAYDVARSICDPTEPIELNVTLMEECVPVNCSAVKSCVGPIDEILRAHAVVAACASERFAYNWLYRLMLISFAYASLNYAREPFIIALGRVMALNDGVEDVVALVKYQRAFGEIQVTDNAEVLITRVLRRQYARSVLVLVSCILLQIPWLLLSGSLN